MLRRAILVTLVAVFAAVSAPAAVIFIPIPVPVPPPTPMSRTGDYMAVHKVAVLSAIGTNLQIGDKSLLSKGKQANIDDWNVDDQAVSTLEQLLAKRFEFKDVPYDRKTLAVIPNGPLDDSTLALQKFLGPIPKDDIDAFIIVRPDLEQKAPGSPGLTYINNADDTGRPAAFANYEIDVVTARDLKIIAKSYSRVQDRAAATPGFAAYVLFKEMSYNNKTMELTADQRKVLRAIYYRLIPHSLLETVRSLDFGIDLPAVGGRSLVQRTADKNAYKDIRSVAVVSAVGDEFVLQHVSYSRSGDRVDIADWKLDELIESEAREAINAQYPVKEVAVDRAQLAQSALVDDKRDYHPDLKGLAETSDVDAYIVFVKHPFTFRNSTVKGRGAGMVHFGSLLRSTNNVFVYYDVALVDAHTLKVIRAMSAAVDPGYFVSSPSRTVEASLWADTAKQLMPEQKDQIHQVVKELIDASVKETLLRLNLTDKVIVDSWPLPSENSMEAAPP